MKSKLLVVVVAVAMVGGAALYTHQSKVPSSTRRSTHAPYTTGEVLEFLLLATGRVAKDHPSLENQRPLTAVPEMKTRAAMEVVSRCIDHIDALAMPALTSAFNAADPQRLDGALRRFDVAASRWTTGSYKQNDPCPPPPPPPYEGPIKGPPTKGWFWQVGDIAGKYVVAGVNFYALMYTIGGAFAVTELAAVAEILLVAVVGLWVPEFFSYQFENAPGDLDRQTILANLTKVLRA